MNRYWIFENLQLQGPYEPAEIIARPGFPAKTSIWTHFGPRFRSFLSSVGAALFFITGPLQAKPACEGHGGVASCDASAGLLRCVDWSLDKTPCSRKTTKVRRPRVQVLKFKPATDRGQIVSPGETPPPTTLKNSK